MSARRLALAVPALLLLAVAAAVVFRLPLAEIALRGYLANEGIEASAKVTRLALDGATLQELHYGADRAARVEIGYRPAELLAGRLESLSVEGLRLTLDLTGAAAPSDAKPTSTASNEPPSLPLALSHLSVTDATLTLATAQGEVTVQSDATLAAEESEITALDATLRAENPGGDRADLTLTGTAADGLALTLAGHLQGGTLAALLPGRLAPNAGSLRLKASAEGGRLADLHALALSPEGWRGWLESSALTASLALEADSITLSGRAGGIALSLAARLEQDGTARRLYLEAPASLQVHRLDPAWLSDLGLPPEAALRLADGVSATASAQDGPLLAWPRAAQTAIRLATNLGLTLADGATARLALDARHAPTGPLAALAAGRTEAVFTLGLSDLHLDGIADGLGGKMAGHLLHTEHGGRLELNAPLTLQAATLAPAWLAQIGLPPELAEQLSQGGRLEVAARDAAALLAWQATNGTRRLSVQADSRIDANAGGTLALQGNSDLSFDINNTLQDIDIKNFQSTTTAWRSAWGTVKNLRLEGAIAGPPDALAGTLDLAAEVDRPAQAGLSARTARLTAPLSLAQASDGLTVSLRAPGRLRIAGLSEARLAAPLDLDIPLSSLTVTQREADSALSASLEAAPAPLHLAVKRVDAPPLPLALRLGRIALTAEGLSGARPSGTLALSQAEIELPGQPVALSNLDLTARFDAEQRLHAQLRRGEARPAGALAFPPLALSGSLAPQGRNYAFEGTATGLDGALRLSARGHHDPASGRGHADLTLTPLAFAPGGLQPGALSPSLAGFEDASGSAEATAALDWTAAGFDGTGRVALAGIGFTHQGIAVEGLALDLALDHLLPPQSPPGQKLTIARIAAGPEIEDLEASLRLLHDPTQGALVALDDGRASAFGGRLRLSDGRFALAGPPRRVTLEAEGLNLASLVGVLELDELSASGTLSGRIPVRLENGSPVVEAAALSANGSGVVAFRSPEARQSLAAGGQAVDLMLQALEDFHYDELSVGFDMPGDGETRTTLRLRGANPAVLDGYPFDININLLADPAPLLSALAEGTRLKRDVIRRLWRLER